MSESECVGVTSVSVENSWTKMCKRIQYNHTQPLQIELGKQTVSLETASEISPTYPHQSVACQLHKHPISTT